MTDNQILINLLNAYERLHVENHALRVMLSTSNVQEIRDTWETTFQEVLRDPEVVASLAPLHAEFEKLRAQVLSALDAEAALRLLLRLPQAGRIN